MTAPLRLFFATWPAPGTARALAAMTRLVAAGVPARPVAESRLHLTLAFLGDVPAQQLPEVEAAAAGWGGPALDLPLEVVDWWRGPRVLVARPATTPAALEAAVGDLWQRLALLGLRAEHPVYRPHVTLARRVAAPPAAVGPVADPVPWQASEFTLVHSTRDERGPVYRVLRHWPLAAGPGPRGPAP